MDFIWYFCHKLILNDSFCSLLFFIKPISYKWNPQLMSKINYDSTRWLSKTRGMVSAECQYGLTVQISSAAEARFRPCRLQSRVEVLNLSVAYIVWYHVSRHYVQMPYIVGKDKVDHLLFSQNVKNCWFYKIGRLSKRQIPPRSSYTWTYFSWCKQNNTWLSINLFAIIWKYKRLPFTKIPYWVDKGSDWLS